MHLASYYGRIEVVQILLAYGANINEKDNVSNVIFVVCGDGELMMRIVNTVIVMLFVFL